MRINCLNWSNQEEWVLLINDAGSIFGAAIPGGVPSNTDCLIAVICFDSCFDSALNE